MAETVAGSERRFDAMVYSPQTSADAPTPDRIQRTGFCSVEPGSIPDQEFTSLRKLGVQKQEMGSFTEAEECFLHALQIGDRILGAEHPELILLVNDLIRLYLKQGSYASAEPFLLRLLDLKKSKGDDHPEVATVLASLATVRQALGRHESAEQLWRHVVDIRDRTLAPNHFATATALEHLGESCAARGKIRAALTAFERARLIRERTLGAEHPSVRASRERIADLQLQGSEDSFYPDDELEQLSKKSPERFRLSSGEGMPVTNTQAVLEDPATEAAETLAERAEPLQVPTLTAYRDALESVRLEIEDTSEALTVWSRVGNAFSPYLELIRERRFAAAIAISAIALVLVGAAFVSGTATERDHNVNVAESGSIETPAAFALAATNGAIAPAGNRQESTRTPTVAKPATAPRIVETHSTSRTQSEKPLRPNIAIPVVSTAMMSRVDSVASKTAIAPNRGIESFALQPLAAPIPNRASMFADNQTEAPQHARLIGELPKPSVPSQLANVEGDVRLRFTVDTDGRPVMSSVSVMSSTHQALTDAVKRVIPSMRFEPAKTGGPDPKAVTEVVQLSFVFSSHGQ
jgi:TonB family protein